MYLVYILYIIGSVLQIFVILGSGVVKNGSSYDCAVDWMTCLHTNTCSVSLSLSLSVIMMCVNLLHALLYMPTTYTFLLLLTCRYHNTFMYTHIFVSCRWSILCSGQWKISVMVFSNSLIT